MHTISLAQMSLVVGGQQAQAPAPQTDAETPERDSYRDREREDENDRFREWERRHPFQAMLCQGDRDCAEMGGFR